MLRRHSLALAALLGLAAGCGAPRYVDAACLSRCERENDTCLLQATTAAAVQSCEERTSACVRWCG